LLQQIDSGTDHLSKPATAGTRNAMAWRLSAVCSMPANWASSPPETLRNSIEIEQIIGAVFCVYRKTKGAQSNRAPQAAKASHIRICCMLHA
jgi:hypothetical protein